MNTHCTNVYTPEAVSQDLRAVAMKTRSASTNSNSAEYVICPFPGCEKRIKGKYNLIIHSRKHTDEKPYVCTFPDCSLSFKWRSGLQNHRRKHTKLEVPKKLKAESPTFVAKQKIIPFIPVEVSQSKTADAYSAVVSAHKKSDNLSIAKVINKTHKNQKSETKIKGKKHSTSSIPLASISDSAESLINFLFETVEQGALIRTGTIPPFQPCSSSRGADVQFERKLNIVLSEHDFLFARRCAFDRILRGDYVGSQSTPGGGLVTNSLTDTVWPMNSFLDREVLGLNSDISTMLMPENAHCLTNSLSVAHGQL
jgi:hypothetical protein